MWGLTYRTLILSGLTCLVSATSSQSGEPIQCSCRFESASGYSAVGTRAACSTFTKEKACTVAFGGIGAQAPKVSQLGLDPAKYRDTAFALTMANLDALRTNSPDKISTPAFLQEAVVVYMRAAYLRENLEIDRDTLQDIDRQVQDFSKEFANSMADVFQAKRPPFTVPWRGSSSVEFQRGAVRFLYNEKIAMTAIFF